VVLFRPLVVTDDRNPSVTGFKINKRAIEKMQRDIAKEFERAARKHPIRVPVQVDVQRCRRHRR
jgi:hypothetical protein